MRQSITLRAWQKEALQMFSAQRPETYLAVACPGAGKTTFALAATRQWLGGERLPLVVVVPTAHLKRQWAEAALRFGFHLDPAWSAAGGPPAADMHGVIVTYAQTASSSAELASFCAGGLVILDEIHHAANERSWGDGVRNAFEAAACRLLLSGTPFRTDDSPIPFVKYSWGDYGEAEPDYEYGYGEALNDGGVVRPVYFPRFDGHMEWVNSEGQLIDATFEDEILQSEWGARLRTALSLDGGWLKTVLGHAEKKLRDIRETHADAGGLIIAIDHDHARGIARQMEMRHGISPRIALSDDPKASDVIEAFANSDEPWIIAVRMISEGVDIPRLRVAVFATTTTTAMFFRQAVGRIARWTTGVRSQKAFMYLPDDVRLRGHATALANQRRHSIELRKTREVETDFDTVTQETGQEEQLSLFAALSSTVIDEAESAPSDGLDHNEKYVTLPEDLEGFPIDLPPPPPLPGRDAVMLSDDPWATPSADSVPQSRAAEKARLREKNAMRVREIVARTGQSYPEVNAELNRLSNVKRITAATVADMERRLRAADKWLSEIARSTRRSSSKPTL